MAYSRRTVTDFETVMNADLYNNLQDGIDEGREAMGDINVTEKGTVQAQLDRITQNVSNVRLVYNRETQYMEYGTPKEDGGGEPGEGGNGDMDEDDIITPEEAAEIFNNAEAASRAESA